MKTFTNKHFLKLLDFTSEEIGDLLDLAADLKAKKKAGIPISFAPARISFCCSRRIPPGPAALLRWLATIWAWV